MDIMVTNIEEILRSTIDGWSGWTVVDFIKWRAWSNQEWSSRSVLPPDEYPSKIYYTFKALVRKIFKRSTGKDATFQFDGKNWIAVPVEEGDEDTISEDEFCFEEDSDEEEEEEDVEHRTDEGCSEGFDDDDDDRDKDDKSLTHSGDESSEMEEEKWEDAFES
ncbi:MAG: hypothetical protein LQ342_005398 [Letrouitia transgressa]|nr:MAG: hypothetical protein LQ342_005398 [Letrouitia transgressa]